MAGCYFELGRSDGVNSGGASTPPARFFGGAGACPLPTVHLTSPMPLILNPSFKGFVSSKLCIPYITAV